jgi:hypothetical protein
MTLKMHPDADGHSPPSSILSDYRSVVEFELYKKLQFELDSSKKRKAPCSCKYFEGILPSTHKCYTTPKKSIIARLQEWILRRLSAFRT